ncbi:Protein O-mannosyltransferase 2 [Rhizophlyctis rosea]|uniref:Dolichyl-phosphate-mannose--protein mannosyltransferase n=1 Tax=Rhizophlyctis rosea TaxID=64517 RepID=A0AAD5X1N0_9FUNG|nr:Protein O-mannosyltransferase 2 [Rhizophlyctis rosea]
MDPHDGLRKRAVADISEEAAPLLPETDLYDKTAKPPRTTPKVFTWQPTTRDYIIGAIFTALALWTRLYKIKWADYVVWDEAHFGKFASHYIKRDFYFDVHPPLGKMLNGLAGVMAGYNGTFEFESGHKYPEEINYGVMRIVNALFGAGTVPLAYYTGIHLHLSRPAAVLLASMALLDVALLCISRFILLDSMLLFFTCLSVYTLVVFRNYQKTAPFSAQWWFWIFATGLTLGACASVKWVGFFAIALVGLHTIEELWDMFGDLKMPPTTYVQHWIARILALIVTPIAVYMFSFWLHFTILNRSGPGDAQMSSLFQANLLGSNFENNPIHVAYGSKITLKNNGHGGGLLHSHVQRFPTGSEQQQVTCYHHKDENNGWFIRKPWDQPGFNSTEETDELIKDGSIIRLVHSSTSRNLHSHNVKAPVTTSQNEVSCYGNNTVGDRNDLWKVEKVDDTVDSKGKEIRALTTRLRLRHLVTGCLLRSHSVSLPQWGFKQNEVVCEKKGDPNSRNNMWNVEQHFNEKLPMGSKADFKTSFIKDFIDLNVAMWTSNNALTPDPDKEPDALTSAPYQWPLMLVGLRMCAWGDSDVKFWLIGNPVIWWGSTASIVIISLVFFVYILRAQRKIDDWKTPESWDNFWFAVKVGVIGWVLHYGPFWIMGRVTYLHHYFPALYFAMIAFSHTVDHIGSKFPKLIHYALVLAVNIAVIANFLYFKDFAFGFNTSAFGYTGRKWLKSWNLHD